MAEKLIMPLQKTQKQLEKMRRSGALLSRALSAAAAAVRPGATTGELDRLAEEIIRAGGGEPSFLGYKTRAKDRPYPTTMCTSINHEVVHAPAEPSRELKNGDIVGLDLGVRLEGWCTDAAVTVIVGEGSRSARRLQAVTREALSRGLSVVAPGRSITVIGRAIQEYVERNGFSVVRDLVGHGIGESPHEEPRVPNFYDPRFEKIKLLEGMVIFIEPMVNIGGYQVSELEDGWTVVTADNSLSAHFEVTLTVTAKGYEILTPLPL